MILKQTLSALLKLKKITQNEFDYFNEMHPYGIVKLITPSLKTELLKYWTEKNIKWYDDYNIRKERYSWISFGIKNNIISENTDTFKQCVQQPLSKYETITTTKKRIQILKSNINNVPFVLEAFPRIWKDLNNNEINKEIKWLNEIKQKHQVIYEENKIKIDELIDSQKPKVLYCTEEYHTIVFNFNLFDISNSNINTSKLNSKQLGSHISSSFLSFVYYLKQKNETLQTQTQLSQLAFTSSLLSHFVSFKSKSYADFILFNKNAICDYIIENAVNKNNLKKEDVEIFINKLSLENKLDSNIPVNLSNKQKSNKI